MFNVREFGRLGIEEWAITKSKMKRSIESPTTTNNKNQKLATPERVAKDIFDAHYKDFFTKHMPYIEEIIVIGVDTRQEYDEVVNYLKNMMTKREFQDSFVRCYSNDDNTYLPEEKMASNILSVVKDVVIEMDVRDEKTPKQYVASYNNGVDERVVLDELLGLMYKDFSDVAARYEYKEYGGEEEETTDDDEEEETTDEEYGGETTDE